MVLIDFIGEVLQSFRCAVDLSLMAIQFSSDAHFIRFATESSVCDPYIPTE